MKREIKFRSWDKENKTMNKVSAVHSNGACHIEVPRSVNDIHLSKDEFELMQFTGLKDKNGKEIYEGDIVTDFLDNPAIVRFGKYSAGGTDYYASGAYGFYVQRLTNGKETEDDTQTLDEQVEILGNIYENPELLS